MERWGRGRGGRAWRRQRERVFRRDDFLCQVCLCQGRRTLVTLSGTHHGVCDHIVPISQGGTDHDANLQCLCQACDRAKTWRESQEGVG